MPLLHYPTRPQWAVSIRRPQWSHSLKGLLNGSDKRCPLHSPIPWVKLWSWGQRLKSPPPPRDGELSTWLPRPHGTHRHLQFGWPAATQLSTGRGGLRPRAAEGPNGNPPPECHTGGSGGSDSFSRVRSVRSPATIKKINSGHSMNQTSTQTSRTTIIDTTTVNSVDLVGAKSLKRSLPSGHQKKMAQVSTLRMAQKWGTRQSGHVLYFTIHFADFFSILIYLNVYLYIILTERVPASRAASSNSRPSVRSSNSVRTFLPMEMAVTQSKTIRNLEATSHVPGRIPLCKNDEKRWKTMQHLQNNNNSNSNNSNNNNNDNVISDANSRH